MTKILLIRVSIIFLTLVVVACTGSTSEPTEPPVVLQETDVDNGPAALRAVLLTYGLDLPQAVLRDRLSADSTGTSIDDIEELAVGLGVTAEQLMVPPEHLTVATRDQSLLPAIVIVENESGVSRFVVLWRIAGNRVQIMDTRQGIMWLSARELESSIFRHDFSVPNRAMQDHSMSDAFLGPIQRRIQNLGLNAGEATALVDRARGVSGCAPAALDAAVRWHKEKGNASFDALEGTLVDLLAGDCEPTELIPESYWFVTPDPTNPDFVTLHGAVIVTFR